MIFSKFSIRTKLFVLFFVVFIALVVMGHLMLKSSQKALVDARLVYVNDFLKDEAHELEDMLREFRNDAEFLSQVPPIQGIIRARAVSPKVGGLENTDYADWIVRLEAIFVAHTTTIPHCRQMRFIDENGNELVRVNFNGQSVSYIRGKDLQNKTGEFYFKEIMKVAKGSKYVSDMTLNRESGKIETPHVPMIRVAAPVFDDTSGARRGFIIINVDASTLTHDLKMVSDGNIYLVNSDGYYLHHPDPSREFGFQLGAPYNLRLDDPVAVVYLTTHSDDELLQQAKITEPYGYLLKPTTERELHVIIEMALNKHEMETKITRFHSPNLVRGFN